MSFRVSTASLARTSLNDISQTQQKIAEAREQISTGQRINRPSDDPAQAAQLRELDTARERLTQYDRNASMAESRLAIEESTFGSMGDTLNRIRELTVQAANDSNGPAERNSIAVEIEGRLEGLYELANVRDSGGDALFAGSLGAEDAFSPHTDTASTLPNQYQGLYSGDSIERRVSLGAERSVVTAHTGSEAFVDITDDAGNTRDLFGRVFDLVQTMRNPTDTSTALQDELVSLDGALEHINTLRAESGTRLNNVDASREESSALALQLDTTISSMRDADLTEAIVRLESETRSLEVLQKSHARLSGISILDYL